MSNRHLKFPKPCNWRCKICGVEDYVKPSALEKVKTCGTPTCKRAWASQAMSGGNNPAYGRIYRSKATHPEWAASISKTSTERQINAGEKNGMKDPEVRARQSKTRRERVTSDPSYREARRQSMISAWASGKYDGVKVGKCKWYDHTTWEGNLVKLQGTWEVAFARRLDELKVSYETHRGRWNYVDGKGTQRSYYPDFYVLMWDAYIDVKGAFWDDEQREKIGHVKSSNQDKTLVVANKGVLDTWCVKLLETQGELLT